MKHAVIILAVLTGLTLAACGEKQHAESPPPPQTTVDTLSQQTPPPRLPETVRPETSSRPRKQAPVETPEPAVESARKAVTLEELPTMVDAHRDRLRRIYREQAQVIDMSGSVTFTIHIDDAGLIEKVEVTPDLDAKFTHAFLDAAMEDVGAWNLPVDRATTYTFRMTFMDSM